MTYLFDTPEQRQKMLGEIGVDSIEELFAPIPGDLRLNRALDLPLPLSEMELEQLVSKKAAANITPADRHCFMGGGVYDHFIPAVVDEIAGRGEYYTAYTPYQPESSQGTLQAFFEYQSLICDLTGMPVSNASLYEGATSVSEAAFMAMRVTGRDGKVIVLGSVHPEYREVLTTYLSRLDVELVEIPCVEGTADPEQVREALDDRTACVIVQHPNFFGCLEEVETICTLAREFGALSVISFDPLSLGVLKAPGEYGADIAVAEGQPLGVPMQYGGPYLGVFACREDYVRKMPGRLIGVTDDKNGNTCYVLALQTREQHIRRGKATSNICTNQGLLALRATIYLSLLGPEGLKEVGNLCLQKAHYAAEQIAAADGFELQFDRPFFKEFTVRSEHGSAKALQAVRASGCDAGPSLSRFGRGGFSNELIEDAFLVAVTEQRTREEIDQLVAGMNSIHGSGSSNGSDYATLELGTNAR
ncbi:aminomethyl-transferring glycine dehydrogenase subunit GcvPA [Calycomorphotria hydatis]|uniref:Probable glycine dehydrogenase (decarboxylating) subunit 1 n=1 Tax=Calycomorphotria hydatis TaxID=2528027 RepID=A0A517TAN4_9PLAN|nr:aminomethyl-transferring glycine dehydrogenase subunit GcvPA [Calycomorphotria hydatis]QDT65438.1 putative glycine dehydrogenase (decarboxylating) subunit 1 [Calycomorphotria hydatis]